MKKYFCCFVTILAGACTSAHAYELATHGQLTYEAYKRSALLPNPNNPSDPQLAKNLGVDLENTDVFGNTYFDISGSDIRERTANPFERNEKRMPDGVDPLSIAGWLLRGSIREDDLGQLLGINLGGDPHDDPYGNIFRVFHHFYDPVYNRPLMVTGIGLLGTDIHTAPAWGLGTTNANAFTQPLAAENGRRNHFSVFDAREAMYRALTGKKKDGTDAGPNNQPTTEAHRKAYWATLFRALGDVVHLVQDMGQPQHTRNDPHAGYGAGHESFYEAYLDCRATGNLIRALKSAGVKRCDTLSYIGYPLPTFTKYSDYFSTRTGINGKGLADYSNRGFFSAGSNLGSNSNPYSLPSNNAGSYTLESTAIAGLIPNNPLVEMNFLQGNVTDTQVPGSATIRLTTQSLFDSFLGTTKSYHLNRYNYDEMAKLLIPRAVAYSAGMIDYFFRGRLQAIDAALANTEITFKIKNAIDPVKVPAWANETL